MKFLFFVSFITFCFCAIGQSQKSLIKKYSIKKVTAIAQEDGATESNTTITYYDASGNDTSTYTNGNRYQYSIITYDKQNRIAKKQSFWNDGKLVSTDTYTYTYTYSKDGSFTELDVAEEFGLKTQSWYNAKGNIIKSQTPDGTIRVYTYDAKGNVIKMQVTEKGKKPAMQTAKYKFDSRGRAIETTWSDGSHSFYKYDERGLLTEAVFESHPGGDMPVYKGKTIYQYE